MKAWRILEYQQIGPIIVATDEAAKDAIVERIERQYSGMAVVQETEIDIGDAEDVEFEEVEDETDEEG